MTTPAQDLEQAQAAIADLKAAMAEYVARRGMVAEYEIAGRRMKFRNPLEINELINFWRREELRAQRAVDAAAGLPVCKKILTRF